MDAKNGEKAAAPLPQACPKFMRCNAPICPLDERWRQAVHLQGERVCYYLTVSGKVGVKGQYGTDRIFLAVLDQLDEVCRKHPIIAKRVAQAAKTGFRSVTPRVMTESNAPKAGSGSIEGDNTPSATPENDSAVGDGGGGEAQCPPEEAG
jgi:hypothetical protein